MLLRIKELERKVQFMSQELEALRAQVEASDAVIDSAVTLLKGIADQIKAAGTDGPALTKLASDLKAKTDALAAAVAANTPAAEDEPAADDDTSSDAPST